VVDIERSNKGQQDVLYSSENRNFKANEFRPPTCHVKSTKSRNYEASTCKDMKRLLK